MLQAGRQSLLVGVQGAKPLAFLRQDSGQATSGPR